MNRTFDVSINFGHYLKGTKRVKTVQTIWPIFLMLVSMAIAFQVKAAPVLIDPALNKAENSFLDDQAKVLLGLVNETLTKYPPTLEESIERQLSLYMIDAVLHDVYAAKRTSVQAYFHNRLVNAAKELEATEVTQGAIIWKLYNHAFIIRTATVTIAFDLTGANLKATAGFALPDALVAKIVAESDVLFISHRHGDHADKRVAQAFLNQGKKGSSYRGGNKLIGYNPPLLSMTWGESYHYYPSNKPAR